MKNALPEGEGTYFMIDDEGNKTQVKIKNMSTRETHQKNLHVFETESEYYALSIENGYDQYSWHKIK